MSSEGERGAQAGIEMAEAAGGLDGAGAEFEHRAAAAAMDEAVEPAAAQPLGRTGAGALAAMEAAATVLHGGLAAGTARAGAGAATGGRQVIAGGIAVPEAAARLAESGVKLGAGRCLGPLGPGQRRQRQGGRVGPDDPQLAGGFTHGPQLLAEPGGETGHRLRGHGPGKGSAGRADTVGRKAFLQ
jgi:hypothetical protein